MRDGDDGGCECISGDEIPEPDFCTLWHSWMRGAAGEGVCHGVLSFEQAEPSGVLLLPSVTQGCMGPRTKSATESEILKAFTLRETTWGGLGGFITKGSSAYLVGVFIAGSGNIVK